MFRIKICGITRPEDARAAADAGADAVGLNFYPQSSRYLSVEQESSLDLDCAVLRVGVFVNGELASLKTTVDRNRLDAIQLHGDEPPDTPHKLPTSTKVIRAYRLGDEGTTAIAKDLEQCAAAGRVPDAILVDAFTPGQYGGTGETVSWAGLADYRRSLGEIPLILAGGLTPENVAAAIRTVRPHGVDVASGVEISPGVKCPDRMRSFILAAKSAFLSIDEKA